MILVLLSGGGRLETNPAASYERMSRAAGHPLRTNSTTRTREEQAALYDGWVKRKPGYNYALPPGQSVHETGYAMDVDNSEYAWMEKYGAEHGWHRTNPNERWHYEYVYATDAHRNDESEDDMFTEEDRHRARVTRDLAKQAATDAAAARAAAEAAATRTRQIRDALLSAGVIVKTWA